MIVRHTPLLLQEALLEQSISQPLEADLLSSVRKHARSILELGCGAGRTLMKVAGGVQECCLMGVDQDRDALDLARYRLDRLTLHGSYRLYCADLLKAATICSAGSPDVVLLVGNTCAGLEHAVIELTVSALSRELRCNRLYLDLYERDSKQPLSTTRYQVVADLADTGQQFNIDVCVQESREDGFILERTTCYAMDDEGTSMSFTFTWCDHEHSRELLERLLVKAGYNVQVHGYPKCGPFQPWLLEAELR